MAMEVIDIPYDRLCQWLCERNKIPKDWAAQIDAVQNRVHAELGSLPPLQDLDQLTNADFVGFNEVSAIVECLIKDETARGQTLKSMFGRYINPKIRLWDNLKREYRKGNLFLAEIGQQLLQTVKYDIPALKAELKQLVKSIDDCNRQAADKEKHALLAKEKYDKLCKRYDVDPSLPPRPQIGCQTSKLQYLFQEILLQLKKPVIQECLSFYTEFLAFTYAADDRSEKPQRNTQPLRSLTQLVRMETAVTPAEALQLSLGCSAADDIRPNEVVEIEWNEQSSGAVETDWDISCVDASANEPDAIAAEDPVSLLDTSFRNSVRTELIELQFFLKQRYAELSSDSVLDVFSGYAEGNIMPYFVKDRFWTETALRHVRDVQALLDSEQIERLLKIRSSPSYLDRLVASFDIPRSLEKKCLEKAAGLHQRIEELRGDITRLHAQTEQKIAFTRSLKAQVESELVSLYNGKSVKLIGEIGNALRSKQ